MRSIVAGKSAAKDALTDIRKWLKGAERIAICDPYIMHPKKAALFNSDPPACPLTQTLRPRWPLEMPVQLVVQIDGAAHHEVHSTKEPIARN